MSIQVFIDVRHDYLIYLNVCVCVQCEEFEAALWRGGNDEWERDAHS